MMDWRKVHAMEHSIFDTLKKTECCRGFSEYCVRWVEDGKVRRRRWNRKPEYLLLFVAVIAVVDAEATPT